MTIKLSAKAQKLVNERLKSGRYSTPEEVVLAGLDSLRRQEQFGNFGPGELERLVAEGERSIEREGTVAAEEVFAALRQRSKAARRRTNSAAATGSRGRRK
jgi:antitoxin ParD1/3/4